MIQERLLDAMKTAMKSKETETLGTIRMIQAQIKDQMINNRTTGKEMTEADVMRILESMIKQRRDGIKLYEQGKRQDLADKEAREIGVIESFLPTRLSPVELEASLKTIFKEENVSSVKDMGKVMATLRTRHPGQFDAALAAEISKKLLEQL